MTTTAFIAGVLALLLAPGPTNTLMGLAGAQGGLSRVIRLIPAELAGYATSILPLSFLGAELIQTLPGFGLVLKAAAAVWIAVLAIKLWTAFLLGEEGKDTSAKQVYVTTCLNPKALVFSLVLLPPLQSAEFPQHLLVFAVMVIGVALTWGGLGTMTRVWVDGTKSMMLLQRGASVWLMIVSLSLMVDVGLG